MMSRIFRLSLIVGVLSCALPSLVTPSARAANYTSTPTVTWVASAVPASSRISLDTIVTIDSRGRRTWTTRGACIVSGKYLVTTKTGICTISLRLASTSQFSAASSTNTLQVKKKSELTVLAAASLSGALTEIGNTFMKKYRNVTVEFSFAGSSTLATQIQQGAPVDVVAMADTANMDRIVAGGFVKSGAITTLAKNKLAILVQRGNPLRIASLNDLTRSGLTVVLCDTSQPCGKYASTALVNARVSLTPASREASASAVVMRVANGEADAGIAYITDGLITGDKVDPVAIPDSVNVVATYPIGAAAQPHTSDVAALKAFVSMSIGMSGRTTLTKFGFMLP